MSITCCVEKITPTMAKLWLEANTNNFRHVTPQRVAAYTAAMANGDWDLTGESIIFHADGTLLNGQHRLAAVVRSGATIESVVVRGVLCKSLHTDRGKPRTVTQWLAYNKVPNAALVAAAARMCVAYDKGLWAVTGWGVDRLLDTEIVDFAMGHHKQMVPTSTFVRIHGISTATLTTLLYIGSGRNDPSKNEVASWFVEGLRTGADLQDTDAVLHLRNRLERQTKGHGMTPFMTRMVLTLAWNKTVQGVECSPRGLQMSLTGPRKQTLPTEILIAE